MVRNAIRVIDTTALVDYLADLLLEDLLPESRVAEQTVPADNDANVSSRDLRPVLDR